MNYPLFPRTRTADSAVRCSDALVHAPSGCALLSFHPDTVAPRLTSDRDEPLYNQTVVGSDAVTGNAAKNLPTMNTRNLMKLTRKSLLPLLFLLLNPASRLLAQEASPTLVTNPPAFGTFYWLSGFPRVPYPFDPARGLLPIWSLNGVYWVDDSELLQNLGVGGEMMMGAPSPGGGGGSGLAGTNFVCGGPTNFLVSLQSSTNLWLSLTALTNNKASLVMRTSDTNASYDVFGSTNLAELVLPALSRTNWMWLLRATRVDTNFNWLTCSNDQAWFQLGTMRDSDNDGLTDAYENLVSHTATNVANSPRALYENVLSNQSPSGWFKLNESNLLNAASSGGVAVTNQGGLWDPDAFATGNGAYSFSATSDRLMVTNDVIGGGTSDATNQGSFTLLFKAMTAKATSKRYVLSQGTSVHTNTGNAIAVYFDGTNNGALTLGVGPVERIILTDTNLIRGAWYYLAVTCDETRTSNEVRWYLGPVGSQTWQTGGFALGGAKKFGTSGQITLGNKEGSSSAFRESASTNGSIDQAAFWQRELTEAEVSAQFNALFPLFQGPAKAFDLSRWNILLPVNKTNQLNPSHAALEIHTGWLNSGFKYLDPTNWTQKYFYLSNGGTMVFEVPWNGARSSTNAGPRSELRETSLDGSRYNWQPLGTNTLEATCVVESAGTNNSRKLIIGQIHSDIASDPPIAVNYNFPNSKDLSVTYKFNPTNSADDNLILATNVNVLEAIYYKVQLLNDGTEIKLHAEASINGVPQTAKERTMVPYSAWTNATFYFKAGCYLPSSTTNNSAKVTFSSLTVRHQP
jgi:Alginate lyase/Concanavalin A-like lectin/glucanases superfamily